MARIADFLKVYLKGHWWLAVLMVAVLTMLLVGLVLSLMQAAALAPLMDQANALPAGDTRIIRQREVLQLASDNLAKIWTTLAQVAVGVVLAIGAVATWRNLRLTQETLNATQEKLEVDREAQITNRFTQAIAQLGAHLSDGSPNLEVRLGGIYALERIARDSPRDHWTIMEVLTAYVRQNGTLSPGRPRIDVQAVVTVVGRRRVSPDQPEPDRLDLTGADLHKVDLSDGNLDRAILRRANLSGARAAGASLIGALLDDAVLRGAEFWGVNLAHAYMRRADLRDVHFGNLGIGNLEDPDFDIRSTNLEDASIEDADLDGADLAGTDGLTEEQITSAASWVGARLPSSLINMEVSSSSTS